MWVRFLIFKIGGKRVGQRIWVWGGMETWDLLRFQIHIFCETQWPRPPLFSPSWLIQWSMGEGSYITLFSPSDVTAFHRIWTEWGERVLCVISFVPNVVILVNQSIELGRCLFFINSTIFHSFEAGNCVSNSSFKWMKNTHKQLSSTRFKTWVKIVTIT